MNRLSLFAIACVPFLASACGNDASNDLQAPPDQPTLDAGTDTNDAAPSDDAKADTKADAEADAGTDAQNDVAADASGDTADDTKADAESDAPADAIAEPAPAGPCDGVPDGHAAVSFTATESHVGTFVGFGAWIHNYVGNDVGYSDPYPGCVALDVAADTIRCDFGTTVAGMRVYFMTGKYADQASPAVGWFTKYSGGGLVRSGTYTACIGTTVVGGLQSNEFSGALQPSDEPQHPVNMMFSVPAAP